MDTLSLNFSHPQSNSDPCIWGRQFSGQVLEAGFDQMMGWICHDATEQNRGEQQNTLLTWRVEGTFAISVSAFESKFDGPEDDWEKPNICVLVIKALWPALFHHQSNFFDFVLPDNRDKSPSEN